MLSKQFLRFKQNLDDNSFFILIKNELIKDAVLFTVTIILMLSFVAGFSLVQSTEFTKKHVE